MSSMRRRFLSFARMFSRPVPLSIALFVGVALACVALFAMQSEFVNGLNWIPLVGALIATFAALLVSLFAWQRHDQRVMRIEKKIRASAKQSAPAISTNFDTKADGTIKTAEGAKQAPAPVSATQGTTKAPGPANATKGTKKVPEPVKPSTSPTANESSAGPGSRKTTHVPPNVAPRTAPPSALPADRAEHDPSANQASSAKQPKRPATTPPNPSLDELFDQFRADPTANHLQHLLMRLWNVHGEITRPAILIRKHRQLVQEFDQRATLLVRQILDAADLVIMKPVVPERASGSLVPTNPLNILYCTHATPVFHSNGYAVRTRGIATGLAMNGFRVRVVGRPGYPWDVKIDKHPPFERQLTDEGDVEYVHLPTPGLTTLARGAYIQESIDALVREATVFRPAVIQAASNSQTALIALIAARRLGIPFVYEVRGLWEITQASGNPLWMNSERYQLDVELETLVATSADQVAVITRQLGDELVNRGVDGGLITVVPNAVDTSAIRPLPKDTSIEFAPGTRGKPIIGFAGSLVAYEGLDLLIEAVSQLRGGGMDCHLLLAGSGAAEPELRAKVSREGLSDSIHFLGRISSNQVQKLLSTADVIVCPRRSTIVTEMVSPLKPLESFAAGRVTLLSDVAPHRDLSLDGSIAPLFEADDLSSLAEALETLLRSVDERRNYERRARLWVSDNRTWSAVTGKFVTIYAQASATYRGLTDASRERNLSELAIASIGDGPWASSLPSIGSAVIRLDEMSIADIDHSLSNVEVIVVDASTSFDSSKLELTKRLLDQSTRLGIRSVLVGQNTNAATSVFGQLAPHVDHLATSQERAHDTMLRLALDSATSRSTSVVPYPEKAGGTALTSHRSASVLAELNAVPSALGPIDVARAYALRIKIAPDAAQHLPGRFHRFVSGEQPTATSSELETSAGVLHVELGNTHPSASSRLDAHGIPVINVAPDSDPNDLDAALFDLTHTSRHLRKKSWRALFRHRHFGRPDAVFAHLFRSVGLPARYASYPDYALRINERQLDDIALWANQSVLPVALILPNNEGTPAQLIDSARRHGVAVCNEVPSETSLVAEFHDSLPADAAERMLLAVDRTKPRKVHLTSPLDDPRALAVSTIPTNTPLATLEPVSPRDSVTDDISVYVDPVEALESLAVETETRDSHEDQLQSLLVAGHDLKFIEPFLNSIEQGGTEVLRDKWEFHNKHDADLSEQLLSQATTILCEWGLGNAVWYANHKRADQRLFVRIHSQELRAQYLRRLNVDAVDAFIFVSELVRTAAVAFHGIPVEKTLVIPNSVDTEALALPKQGNAQKVIGFVGSIPQAKRLDLALDVIEQLLASDPDFKLIVKGRQPQDYPWMSNRPDELTWYQRQFDRIDSINEQFPGAIELEGHGDDMANWYSKVGIVLSASDFESFHYTIADGVASGSVPAVLYWPGAEDVYPRDWISRDIESLVDRILRATRQHDSDTVRMNTQFVQDHFSLATVKSRLLQLLNDQKQEAEDA